MKTTTVVLEITCEESNFTSPLTWDYAALLDLPDREHVKVSGARLTDEEFRALLNLYMASDPPPVSQEDDETFHHLLATECDARGIDGWVVAYHEFRP